MMIWIGLLVAAMAVFTLYRFLTHRVDIEAFAPQWPRGMSDAEVDASVGQLLARMTLREKIAQLSGDGGVAMLVRLGFYVYVLKRFPNVYAGYNRRLSIPPISFTDGPRGIVVGHNTAFPVAMARGASWDVALEQRVGEVIGREARARGANYFAGLCVNLLRHPAWGRAQETYGEDSVHLAAMGTALMRGVQSQGVMVCAKHFAVNSIENSRFYLDVTIDETTLHEVYLPHFRKLVDAGVDSLMSAYNQVNGVYCGHSAELLDDILRKQWGFKGFVSSDWLWGIYETVSPLRAGMDVEMPYARHYGRHIEKALQRGEVTEAQVERSAARVLRAKLRWLSHLPDLRPDADVLACAEHEALAQTVAEQSMVLLKNEGSLLPLQKTALRTLVVIGELAQQPCLGDNGSSRVSPPRHTSFLDGLQHYLAHDVGVIYCDGADVQQAAALAAVADAALLVVGCHADDEGENLTSNRQPVANPAVPRGGDRASLTLRDHHEQLILAVAARQPRTVVSVVAGSAIIMENWRHQVPAIVYAWYAGMAGGHALARVLFGEVNPSGKLPFVIPHSMEQLPDFDRWSAKAHYSYLHGYRLLDQREEQPAFAFGHGLSYTRFDFSGLRLSAKTLSADDTLQVTLAVSNAGERAGATVVQCYVGATGEQAAPAVKKSLQAFAKIYLQPGEQREVTLTIAMRDLAHYRGEAVWQVLAGDYCLLAGSAADDLPLQSAFAVQ